MHIDCLEHKGAIMHATSQWQKGITDILIICQLYSFVMGEQHVLSTFVLRAVELWFFIHMNKS